MATSATKSKERCDETKEKTVIVLTTLTIRMWLTLLVRICPAFGSCMSLVTRP